MCRVLVTRIADQSPSVRDYFTGYIYFLVVGHMQFVGFLFPTQTLPWQNSIFPSDFALPDVSFEYLIYGAFFLSTAYIPLIFLMSL
jgi:hypothetical protein